MGWEPEGLKETIGGALGFDNRQIKGDLERLASVLDERGGEETGAWRGEQRRRSPSGRLTDEPVSERLVVAHARLEARIRACRVSVHGLRARRSNR
jgi:hypothetical protein